MRMPLFFVSGLFLSMLSFAEPPIVIQQPVVPAPLFTPAITSLRPIYTAMLGLRTLRGQQLLANGEGHTVAASILADCRGNLSSDQKVSAFAHMLNALAGVGIGPVNAAFREGICDNAQVTIIAAIMVCKQGPRNPAQMAVAVRDAYLELVNRQRYRAQLYQVEVAVRMLN